MSVHRVPVKPALVRWAHERSGYSIEALSRRFPKLGAWERGEAQPTFKQLDAFAKATHTPFGYFFLPEPLDEPMPIPDLRAVASVSPVDPSLNLLNAIYRCQGQQSWYREFLQEEREPPLKFAGSARITDRVGQTAASMRKTLGIELDERVYFASWAVALRRIIEHADARGIVVIVSGVVGSNTRRRLDPQEFRGLALADPWAPLVFVNAVETKASQMFTLVHELAHIWLGESGVSDTDARSVSDSSSERWCSQVAAEVLVPSLVLRDQLKPGADINLEVNRLARFFKVSTLVILRRIHDIDQLPEKQFRDAYEAELARLNSRRQGGGGGFQLPGGARVSKRFAQALVGSTLEGRTMYTEALDMLGVKKMACFDELRRSLGFGR